MRKLNTLIAAALSVLAVTSANAGMLSSAGTNGNSLTVVRAAALAQFERAHGGAPVMQAKSVAKAVTPATAAAHSKAVTPSAAHAANNAATYAAPNQLRALGRVAYLRALAAGDVASASYDFGTSPQFQRATR